MTSGQGIYLPVLPELPAQRSAPHEPLKQALRLGLSPHGGLPWRVWMGCHMPCAPPRWLRAAPMHPLQKSGGPSPSLPFLWQLPVAAAFLCCLPIAEALLTAKRPFPEEGPSPAASCKPSPPQCFGATLLPATFVGCHDAPERSPGTRTPCRCGAPGVAHAHGWWWHYAAGPLCFALSCHGLEVGSGVG